MPLGAVTSAAPPALAAEPVQVVAVYVEGPDADAVRAAILSAVPVARAHGVDPATFKKALRDAGQRGDLGNAVTVSGPGRSPLLERVRKAGRQVGAASVIVARVRWSKGKREAWLVELDPRVETLEVDEAVPLAKGDEARSMQAVLGPALQRLEPRAAEEPPKEPVKDEPPPDPASAPRESGQVASALVDVGASVDIGGRWFTYTDGLTNNLRPYDVLGAPALGVHAEVYPLATTHLPVLHDLGITAAYARVFGLDSAIAGGDPIGTTWSRFGVGLRLRFPTGDGDDDAILGISGGYGAEAFTFNDAPEALAPEIPSVSYAFLHGGADARLPLGPVAVLLGAEYRGVLSAGDVEGRFRDASVAGVAARAGLAVPVGSGLELRLTGDYARFFYAFKPIPGDSYVAGGALDQLLALGLGADFVY